MAFASPSRERLRHVVQPYRSLHIRLLGSAATLQKGGTRAQVDIEPPRAARRWRRGRSFPAGGSRAHRRAVHFWRGRRPRRGYQWWCAAGRRRHADRGADRRGARGTRSRRRVSIRSLPHCSRRTSLRRTKAPQPTGTRSMHPSCRISGICASTKTSRLGTRCSGASAGSASKPWPQPRIRVSVRGRMKIRRGRWWSPTATRSRPRCSTRHASAPPPPISAS
jgi:hypothetical protein